MRAFLTGASGFIGSFLAETLLVKGYEVRTLVRTSSNLRWLADLNIECHYGSLSDKTSLKNGIKNADLIIHAANITKANSPQDFYKTNYEGTKNLIESVLESGQNINRFVLISSQKAAGPSSTMLPVDEYDSPKPMSDYGKSMLQAELFTLKHKHNLPFTIIRPSLVYGPRDRDMLYFFKTIKKGIIPNIGGQSNYFSMIFINDLVRGIIKAAESENSQSKIFFLTNPRPCSIEEIARYSLKVFGKKGLRLRVPSLILNSAAALAESFDRFTQKPGLFNRQKVRELKQNFWLCSSKRAGTDLNFEASTSIEKGIQETISWYKENNWL